MLSRRDLLRALGAMPVIPRLRGQPGGVELRYRMLGRTGRWVVPLALGGQASLQWTAAGVDAPDIIVRAVELGVNYLDTANAYGPSQANYGAAFRRLHLAPNEPDYNPALRERLYLASKTVRRDAASAVAELRTTLTTIFGDGAGFIPEGAYLDCFQIHNLRRREQVDQVYEGLDTLGGPAPAQFGALAGLLDYRDGSNYTGLNPEGRSWIRHIGITGHQSSPVLMYALQRDAWSIIDTLLVAVNANDREYSSHQFNVLPVAVARGLGVIAMKVLADGVFYGKAPRFSRYPSDVIVSVGHPGAVSHTDFIRYALSIPGVSCAIIGTGHIDRVNPDSDQLVANMTAALANDDASAAEMQRIENDVAAIHGTATNYFNERQYGMTQPANVEVRQDGDRLVVRWDTALAGAEPILSYNLYAGERLLLSMPFRPQTTLAPLVAWVPAAAVSQESIRVVASENPALTRLSPRGFWYRQGARVPARPGYSR